MCISHDPITEGYQQFQDELIEARLLIPSGVQGVYGRSGIFENIVERLDSFITRMGEHLQPEVIRFPPVLNRAHYQCTDHLESFPDLLGSVHSFTGNELEHLDMVRKKHENEDWSTDLKATDVVLAPAACYALYPTATGVLPEQGRLVDLISYVFRHEPSVDPARMQSFRMREYVRLGSPEQTLEHRDYWLQRGEEMLKSLGLDVERVLANDPFFGRGGKMMKASQKEQHLKYELVVPITSIEKPTAVFSGNYHMDHFASVFNIKTSVGNIAHTACVGFGMERITLALLKAHGFDPLTWPTGVRKVLELC